ncbi:KTSC domain-containing protein [Ensifer sp. 1H6]|uniref:KTSC domain-containing protein n=1 Tax=Ensifer sp. 1H6 TaxID=1911585 RepID=UPI001FD8C262|nr:KTSC domain-containing protein [Ensifer sp. 1H6]
MNWRRQTTLPSTLIHKLEYDPQSRILSVWLRPSGRRYDYREVPPETFESFRLAFGKGRFFNTFIRNRYVFTIGDPTN